MYLTFKAKNAFKVKWYSIRFEFLVTLNYSPLVDVMAQKQFLHVENLSLAVFLKLSFLI